MWFSEHSRLSRQFGLEALGADQQTLGPSGGLIHKFRTLQTFALVYVVEGENEFESAPTGTISIREGELFFLFPGVSHRYGTNAEQHSFSYWYVFDGQLPLEWMKQGLLNPTSPVYNIGKDQQLLSWCKEGVLLANSNEPDRVDGVTRTLLNILHQTIVAGEQIGKVNRKNKDVIAVIAAMHKAIRLQDFNLEQFCKLNQLSFEYVRKAFRKDTGLSPGNYFSRLKLDNARAQLVNSDETVARIGHSLGFEDPYYFSRWFKKRDGASPAHYRETYRDFAAVN